MKRKDLAGDSAVRLRGENERKRSFWARRVTYAMIATDRFREFQQDHGVKKAHTIHARAGEIWYAQNNAGAWVVSWYPHRSDHPDAPKLLTDAEREGVDVGGSEGAIGDRLRTHFEARDTRQLVTVIIEQEASPVEVETVQRVFDESGTPAVVSASYGRYSLIHPDWVVLIEVPLGAFATGLAAKAGADTWDALRAFIERLYEERRAVGHRKGSVQIDEGSRRVMLHDEIPPAAYPALAELSDEGEYFWDRELEAWRKL